MNITSEEFESEKCQGYGSFEGYCNNDVVHHQFCQACLEQRAIFRGAYLCDQCDQHPVRYEGETCDTCVSAQKKKDKKPKQSAQDCTTCHKRPAMKGFDVCSGCSLKLVNAQADLDGGFNIELVKSS